MTITPTATESAITYDIADDPEHVNDPVFAIPLDPMPSVEPAKKPPRRTGARASARNPDRQPFSPEVPAAHHALYRLYNAQDVLLYIGETNNPVERYVEHRETKEWWPEVASHSIEWFKDGREKTQEREKDAIRDEWPLYNVAHQPRGDGIYWVPSYVVDKILRVIDQAVREVFGEASNDQVESVADLVDGAFKPQGDGEMGEIGFPFQNWPRVDTLDLDAVLAALGPFRPDIDNSMRDPKPRRRAAKRCEHPSARGRCGGRLRRDGACSRPEWHVETAKCLTKPLDAVDGA